MDFFLSLSHTCPSLSMCEDLYGDLCNCELEAHEHKESSGQRRGPLVITGGWCGGLKASKTNTDPS